ncbi:hypothetical protein D3C72_2583170 [compost metagenome]
MGFAGGRVEHVGSAAGVGDILAIDQVRDGRHGGSSKVKLTDGQPETGGCQVAFSLCLVNG